MTNELIPSRTIQPALQTMPLTTADQRSSPFLDAKLLDPKRMGFVARVRDRAILSNLRKQTLESASKATAEATEIILRENVKRLENAQHAETAVQAAEIAMRLRQAMEQKLGRMHESTLNALRTAAHVYANAQERLRESTEANANNPEVAAINEIVRDTMARVTANCLAKIEAGSFPELGQG